MKKHKKKKKWEDTTSYSKGEQLEGKVKPDTWTCRVPALGRVIVHRRIDEPKCWFVSAHTIGIDNHKLKSKKIKKARVEALDIIYLKATEIVQDLSDFV